MFSDSKPARLLVVEDEMITARDLQDHLEELGYDVPDVASSGGEALALAASLRPDLVLMDINLGRASRDGVEVARELRERFGLPVIYLTAYADQATLARASQTAPLGYLTKPFERREIHATIQMALVKRQLDAELERARRLESLGTLAGGLAHDLNNILAVIAGNVALASSPGAPLDAQTRAFAKVDAAVRRAKALTDQFLTFSKGGDPVRLHLDLPTLLAEEAALVFGDASPALPPTGHRLELAADLWTVAADEGQMRRVVENLLRNAVQALPQGGGRVTVRAVNCPRELLPHALPAAADEAAAAHFVKLEISDTGVGISPENLAHVCDPYFTTRTTGSGLGLSVCHSIARKHDGFLRIQSVVGEGTTVAVYLPARLPQPADESPAPAPPEASPGTSGARQPLRVLVMDDDALMRDLLASMLGYLGHQSVVTRTGEEALRAYEEAAALGNAFDAVCIDLVNKIGMGGEEMIRRLRVLDAGAVALVCSGYCDHPIMSKYAEYGFDGCLPKPVSLEALGAGLHDAMSARRLVK